MGLRNISFILIARGIELDKWSELSFTLILVWKSSRLSRAVSKNLGPLSCIFEAFHELCITKGRLSVL